MLAAVQADVWPSARRGGRGVLLAPSRTGAPHGGTPRGPARPPWRCGSDCPVSRTMSLPPISLAYAALTGAVHPPPPPFPRRGRRLAVAVPLVLPRRALDGLGRERAGPGWPRLAGLPQIDRVARKGHKSYSPPWDVFIEIPRFPHLAVPTAPGPVQVDSVWVIYWNLQASRGSSFRRRVVEVSTEPPRCVYRLPH